MFTSVDPQWIPPFVELIAAAAQSGRCKVVTTLRADFYHRCLEIPGLTHLMERGQLPLSAPSETLLEMITRPAERAGLRFEEGLPGRILRDTGTDPGSLPLLAYTLDELYHADTADKLLDVSTYESLGGVQGAIGTRADVAFSRLDRETQAVFASVFRELVTVDDTGRAARRRSRLSSITGGAAALRLVTAFTEARLLVQSRDEANQPVVFVAHEALFGSWRRLADWISSARDDLLLQRRVASAANDWEAHGRDDAYRWPHERLVDVYAMLERTGVELDPVAASFVEPEYTRIFPILADPGVEQHRRRYAIDRLVTIGPATVPGLLALLRSGTPVGRTSAGAALARLGDSAVDGLVGVLDVADPDVRLEAVSALRLVGGSGVVIGLAEAVRDEDARVRSAALGALSAVGGPEAREIIATALTDLESDVRWQAAGALGAFGPEAVPHLLSIAGPDDVSVETAQRAMLAIGERGLPQLYDGLRADDAEVQLRAAEVLARIGTAAVPGLVEAVSDADSGVRWRACDVLAAIPVPAELTSIVRRALTAALADADPGVRSAAVYAIARAGGPDAVADVIRMFADDAEEVRWAASDAVSAIGPTVVAQLLGTMEAASGESALASAALKRVSSSPELIGELGRHPGWVNDRIEEVVADAGDDVLDELVDLLGRHDTTVRGAAARTLAQIGRPALLRLIACLEDAEPGVRGSAAWTVGVIAANTRNDPSPTSAALQPLEAMLADVDRDCRSAAADALGAFGEDALPALWRGLRSSTSTHREAARRLSRSLGSIGVPGLLILARENNKVTREAATQCLRELRGPAVLFGLAELHGTEESHVSR
jgi:HEAT repeat protein